MILSILASLAVVAGANAAGLEAQRAAGEAFGRMPAGIVKAAAKTAKAGRARTLTYEGAWFSIDFPADFRERSSIPSSTADGYDSAFFVSPDGEVEFYVYSPQWGGDPGDIALDPKTERMGDQAVSAEGGKTVRRWTIEAKDGSYRRSYVETREGTVSWVIGIRYADDEALARYRGAYVRFKGSIRQLADGAVE